MDLKTEAAARAAVIAHGLKTAERGLKEAVDLARANGRADIALELLAILKAARHAHRKAEQVAALISEHVGGDIQPRSGGDDKPPPEDPPEEP